MVPSFVSWWAMTIGNDALEVKSQLRFVIRLSLVVVVLLKGPCLCARLKGYESVKDLFVLLKSKQPKVYETFDLSSPSTWCQYIFQEAAALDGYLFSRLTFSSNTRLPSHHDGFVGWSIQEEGKKKKKTRASVSVADESISEWIGPSSGLRFCGPKNRNSASLPAVCGASRSKLMQTNDASILCVDQTSCNVTLFCWSHKCTWRRSGFHGIGIAISKSLWLVCVGDVRVDLNTSSSYYDVAGSPPVKCW